MMYSPVQDILYTSDVFSNGLTFYPGDDLNITFENGTDEINDWWLATYTVSDFTGPLTTGGDYYNFFVLNLYPASYDSVQLPEVFDFSNNVSTSGTNTNQNITSWYNATSGSYPEDPFVYQDNLQLGVAGGVLTGYLINDNETAVLSIPTFSEVGSDIGNFASTLQDFLNTANVTSQVIVDLQGNTGGAIFLAFVTFRRFFPDIDPFAGSRRRSSDLSNVLGRTFTDYWSDLSDDDDDKAYYEASEWVVTDRLNAATGANFSSWAEYFGPRLEQNASFSLVVCIIPCISAYCEGSLQYHGLY